METTYTYPASSPSGDGCLRKVIWGVITFGLLLVFLFGFVVGVLVGVMM